VDPDLPFTVVAEPPHPWEWESPTSVRTTALPRSDFFVDPVSAGPDDAFSAGNAATLLGAPPDGDYQLSARVSVGFAAQYDAGVLMLHAGDVHWAKLCFEQSPAGEPMVVSVVTRGTSDDANAFVVSGESVWLRISRIGPAYAFHASTDGSHWQMVRLFSLAADAGEHRVGFEAQSPMGEGCPVRFDDVAFVPQRLADVRDGS
jgi:regulation of enolase protein 1 (concanavalin A-like superfamily)